MMFLQKPMHAENTVPLQNIEVEEAFAKVLDRSPHILVWELWGFLIGALDERPERMFDLWMSISLQPTRKWV